MLDINVELKNTGKRPGKEAVLLFSSRLVASISPDVKRLRGFQNISLNPGEIKMAHFKIKLSDLAFVNTENQTVTEPGDFKILIGDLTAKFNYQ